MSTRQMRRLRKQQEEQEILKRTEEAHSDTDDDDGPALPQPRANAFAGFAALADNEDEDEDQDEDENKVANKSDNEAEGDDHTPETESTSTAKNTQETTEPTSRPKKAKKSKKKKGKKAKPADSADADTSLDQLNELSKLSVQQTLEDPGRNLSNLLQINFQHLKAMNEMRKFLGREAIDAAIAEETAEEAAAQAERLRRRQVDMDTYLRGLPGRTMSEIVLKRNPFIEGKRTWPNDAMFGLTMKAISNVDRAEVEYAFTHNPAYDLLENQFYNAVQTYDPMTIIHFLHKHPYHISSLIQGSKIVKQDQNAALAAELCERALFTFGRVTLSSFRKKLEQGLARIDFARPENRQFYLAGYNYIQNLIRKGTFRTALEWTKLFVSLNVDDPYGMVNWLHVMAIRAHEAQWFVDICDSVLLDETRNVSTGLYVRQTLALAKLQLNDREGALAVVIKGMERLPWLFAALFSQLNLDIPKSIWGAQSRDEHEELHTRLYIHMTKDLWNNPQATSVLQDAARAARKVDITSLPSPPPVRRSIARFIYLDGNTDLLSLVPRALLDVTPNFDFDPLPPPWSENIFSTATQRLPYNGVWDLGDNDDRLGIQERLERLRAAHAAYRPAEEQDGEEGDNAQDQRYDALVRRFNEDHLNRQIPGGWISDDTEDEAADGGADRDIRHARVEDADEDDEDYE